MAQSGKDQVGWIDKSGRAKTWTGIILENSLKQTVIQVGDKTRTTERRLGHLRQLWKRAPSLHRGRGLLRSTRLRDRGGSLPSGRHRCLR